MKKILLCTCDPILQKGLYGPLRDEGYIIENVESPADAIRLIIGSFYEALLLDSDAIGLDPQDTVDIVRNCSDGIRIILIGYRDSVPGTFFLGKPADIEALRALLRGIVPATNKSEFIKEEK